MPTIKVPDYSGGALVNVVAELEHRLGGAPAMPGLHPHLTEAIPHAESYVLVLFDGLGAAQLLSADVPDIHADLVAPIDAGFPTTTTVSLASVATGLAPRGHGLLGYQLWIPEVDVVLNTIRWTTLWGDPVADVDPDTFLPTPNLWERLTAAGVEPVTIQPANFTGSALSRALYRGCRFEGVLSIDELVSAAVQLAEVPGRLVFTYLPQVDYAAHVHGQHSHEYARALRTVTNTWSWIREKLPPGAAMVGVADHGHVDFPRSRQVKLSKADHEGRILYGDGRAMFVKGDGAALARHLPATWMTIDEIEPWWGPGEAHPAFAARTPDGALVADDDALLLHRFSDDRMIGNHGALTDPERLVPLLAFAR